MYMERSIQQKINDCRHLLISDLEETIEPAMVFKFMRESPFS